MTARRLRWAGLLRLAAVVGIVAGVGGVLTGLTPHAAAGEPTPTPFVRVRIDRVTPDVVTTTSDAVVTVSGMVTNIGDRAVRDVMVRLEHAGAVTSSVGLRTSLDGGTDQYQPAADFLTVAPELQRGQEAGFTLSAPVRSLDKTSLGINEPGIYPVLVNVNGTPDYGAPARLDNARFLLPVIGVPPDKPDAEDGAVAPDTSKPVSLTMLWPLADRPRLAPGVPGGTIPVRLVDDDLATSLATGGRLDVLLAAAEVATSHDVDPDGSVGRALCLAVDPDLLVTVNAMTGGYVVSNSPDGPAQQPGTPTHPGTGQVAATTWLGRLRALTHRICVTPLPYADADLDALQRVHDPGLSTAATSSTGDIIDQILDVTSARGATVLPDGPLTGSAVNLLSADSATSGTVAICAAADSQDAATPRRLSPQVVVAPFDPAVGAALAAAGTAPTFPTYADSTLTVRLAHDSNTARRQDALGSMLWHALDRDVVPRTQILVPPAVWSLQADDAQVILTTLATAIRSGLAVPQPLPAVISEAAAHSEPPEAVDEDAPARGPVQRQRHHRHRRQGRPTVGIDRGVDHRRAHRLDRHPVHGAAARGHAARPEPVAAPGQPQWNGRAADGRRGQHARGPVRCGDDRQPGWLVHARHRAQSPAAGTAQRPGGPDPGQAAGRRPAGDEGHRHRPGRTAAGVPAAASADRSELHPAGRDRCRATHPGRNAVGRAGAAVGALQRLRQGAVRDHPDGGRGAGCAGRAAALAPVPRPA